LLALIVQGLLAPAPSAYSAPGQDIAPGCINLVENGGFEQIGPQWQIQPGPRPPMYTNEVTFDNSAQSMRIGNGMELSNIESVSEVRYLPLQFPRDATRIILRFRYLPRYDATPGEDLQQADLYYYNTNQLALSLLNVQESEFNWRLVETDLTAYRGQVLSLRLRVRNDGFLGRTWMYVDNVEIEYCSLTPIPPTATPLPTPIATAFTPLPPTTTTSATPPTIAPTWPAQTPGPATGTVEPPPGEAGPGLPPPSAGCGNLMANGSFETYDDWEIGEDPVSPRYTTDQVHSGARAVLLGNPPGMESSVESYSSVRQEVDLPYGLTSAQLRWWQLASSQEPAVPFAGPEEDRQEMILLLPDLTVIDILARQRSNDSVWQQRAVDLTPYRGQSVVVYFNVYNNADDARTWMYLDDIELIGCGDIVPYGRKAATSDEAESLAQPSQQGREPAPATLLPTESTPSIPASTAIADLLTPTLAASTPLSVTATATSAPLPTATQAGAAVAVLTTPTLAPGAEGETIRRPVSAPVINTSASEPWWRRLLGALAIMCSIPVLIGIIIVLVIQIRRLRRTPNTPYT
jgi:hypothetical protein